MGKDPLEAVKRRVYLAAIAFSLPAILLLWVAAFDSVVRIVFPLFALFYITCAWAIWSRAIPIRLAERLRESVADRMSNSTPYVTASFGLAQYEAG